MSELNPKSNLITGIVPQHDFPKVDLTDSNAAVLDFLLRDREFTQATHVATEENIFLYRIAHPALLLIGENGFDSSANLVRFDAGIRFHEIVSGMMSPTLRQYDEGTAVKLTRRALDRVEYVHPITTLLDMRDAFMDTQPNTSDLLRSVIPGVGEAGIMGAAISRQIDLDVGELSLLESLYNDED